MSFDRCNLNSAHKKHSNSGARNWSNQIKTTGIVHQGLFILFIESIRHTIPIWFDWITLWREKLLIKQHKSGMDKEIGILQNAGLVYLQIQIRFAAFIAWICDIWNAKY